MATKKSAIVNKFNADQAKANFISPQAEEIFKKGKYRVFNGTDYETIHLETVAEQVIESESKKFVSQSEKNSWNSKADGRHNHDDVYAKLVDTYNKTQIDDKLAGKAEATHGHSATNIITDATHRFVTDAEKTNWNDKYSTAETEGLVNAVDTKLTDHIAANETAHASIVKDYKAADTVIEGKVTTVQGNLDQAVIDLTALINAGGTANTELEKRVSTIETTTIPGVKNSITNLDSKLSGQIATLTEQKADKLQVSQDIAAAQTALDNKIKLKADKTYVDGELEKKADVETTYTKLQVDGFLGSKADTSYVNTELGKKVSTSVYNNDMAKKANLDDMTTKLALKADISYVDTGLAGKANSTHTHTSSQITGLGTAATKNVGTASGQIPVLNSNGKLETSILPSIAINETFTAASQSAAMEIVMEIGDILILENAAREAALASLEKGGQAVTYSLPKQKSTQTLSDEYVTYIAAGKMAYLCVDPLAMTFEERFKPLQSSGDTISAGEVQAALNLKVDKTVFSSYQGQVTDALSLKADKETTYTKTDVDTRLNNKVDKITGKGLSTNDFTNAFKTKLEGIEDGANNYVHPIGDGNLHVPATSSNSNGKVLMAGASEGAMSWTSLNAGHVAETATKKFVTPEQITLWTQGKADAIHEHEQYRLISDSYSAAQTRTEINKMRTIVSQTVPAAGQHATGAVWIEEIV